MLSLIVKELEANEILTLKSLWCILKTTKMSGIIKVDFSKKICREQVHLSCQL